MLKKFVPIVGIAAVVFAVFVCSLYFYIFSGEFSSSQSDWGDFGSYIGGTVGALFASLSFLALLYTVYLQREELTTAIKALQDGAESQKKQAENYEAQKFETTFYSLLELHNDMVRSLELNSSNFSGYIANVATLDDRSDVSTYLKERQEHILENVELSQYFRVLYQLLKFIAKNNIKNSGRNFSEPYLSNRTTIYEYENEEKMYASLVRSFVPVKLLPVLAINCIPSYGGLNNLQKYYGLLERYGFLEHMRLDLLPLNLSTFIIFERYSYAMGEKSKNDLLEIILQLKSKYPNLFIDGLMEGGYLHTYSDDVETNV